MRLKTSLWVKGYLRGRQASGSFAAIVRHGDDDAGTVFIKINRLDGQACVYGPAPAGMESDGERRFTRRHAALWIVERDADAMVAREGDFDSDLWVVEVEDRAGAHGLEPWLAAD